MPPAAPTRRLPILLALLLAVLVPANGSKLELTPELARAGVTALDLQGPHEPPVDRFHPDRREVQPALGGRATMHIPAWPKGLNFALDSSAVVRWIWRDIHAALIRFDLATWEFEPDLATGWDVEDTVILGSAVRRRDLVIRASMGDPGENRCSFSGVVHEDGRIVPSEVTVSVGESIARAALLPTAIRAASEALGRDSMIAFDFDLMNGDVVVTTESPDSVEARIRCHRIVRAPESVLFGLVTEDGGDYVIRSGSASNPIGEQRVPKSDVYSVERSTVFTFRLRPRVIWHDGHPFDARDVIFSWSIYANPHVDCDEKRYKFADLVGAEIVEPGVVRFFWRQQYFSSLDAFGFDFPILPSHVLDLSDPDNPSHDEDATPEEQGRFLNEHPKNREWIGLGPYRLVRWEEKQLLEAERFDGYWEEDPRRAGFLDAIRWRYIGDDNAAWIALLNGEIDVFDRMKSEDFFGEATQSELFQEHFYKALSYVGNLMYTGWNMQRSHLSDLRVRRALAQGFDVRRWIDVLYKGYALWTTGPMFFFGPGYDHEVVAYPYDPEAARDLLAEAGYYDRDGDGVVDKDGEPLSIEIVMPAGNKASEKLLQAMQEAYASIGVALVIQPYEWATMQERLLDREFDACSRASALNGVEQDPYQQWHSSQAVGRTSNLVGYADELSDRLIEEGRRELDSERRWALWRQLHARIYELQPYLFGWNVPRKYAFRKTLHGVKLYKFEPGYLMRDLYYEAGTPGTRPLPPPVER